MAKFDFDVIVIGGGAGGMSAAKTVKGIGKKTAIVEKRKMGGDCTWFGCVPSKSLIWAAKQLHQARKLDALSIGLKTPFEPDPSNVMKYVNTIIQRVYEGSNAKVFEAQGITVIGGNPKFSDEHTIDIEGKFITADRFIIATGSSPLIPPVEGINNTPIFTNENIFSLEKLPESLIVLGGGPIGIELCQAFARLGVTVRVVELQDRILDKEDEEAVNLLREILTKEGVKLSTGVRAVKLNGDARRVTLTIEDREKKTEVIEASGILVAVGRAPNVGGLSLENVGVKVDKSGIIINTYLQSTAPNIYACGDVVGPFQFSHMAGYQGVTAALNACLPIGRKADYSGALWTTFTDPELARFGLTEQEAKVKYGNNMRVYRVPYSALDRAKTDSTEQGFAKYILDKKGMLVGVHILGMSAGEIIHEAQMLRCLKHPLSSCQGVLHAYPSYSDITRLAGNKAKLDEIMSNPFVKIALKFFSNKGKHRS